MDLNCSNCDAPVPEGAATCPSCGAGVGTMMFGRKRGLTRTLMGKAIELRNSIPWMSASSVQLLDEGSQRPRRRRILLAAVIAVIGGASIIGVALLRSSPSPKLPATAAQPVAPPPPAAASVRPATKDATGAAGAKGTSSARPRPPKTGTLVVSAFYKGKPVAAKVLINGTDKGNTPVTLALAPRKYTLIVERKGFRRQKRRDIGVKAGKKVALRFDLKK